MRQRGLRSGVEGAARLGMTFLILYVTLLCADFGQCRCSGPRKAKSSLVTPLKGALGFVCERLFLSVRYPWCDFVDDPKVAVFFTRKARTISFCIRARP
jgi:hypothetical protein